MFAVFTTPIQFTKSYNKACQIADAYYNKTGYVVRLKVSTTQLHIVSLQ